MKHIEQGKPLKEPEIADETILQAVDDSLKVLQNVGIPYFESIAREKGLTIPWNKDNPQPGLPNDHAANT